MDLNYGRVTYHHGFDFDAVTASHFNSFVSKVMHEYQDAHKRLATTEGIKYSYQSPDVYLHHVRLFFSPEVTTAYSLVCTLGVFSPGDADVINFLKLLFKAVGLSPLIHRLLRAQDLDAYEFTTYANSLIFNTAPAHPGDPRVFSHSY